MSRRLMALQRQRLAETQLLDQRARRMLHDDILPQLHTAMLTLAAQVDPGQTVSEMVASLGDIHRQLSDLLRALPSSGASQISRLGLMAALRQAVDEEMDGAFDAVAWQVSPEMEQRAREVPTLAAEVIFYAAREAMRNAAHHGRNGDTARPLHLSVTARWHDGLEIGIEDDGVGMSAAWRSGESTRQGLALHSTMMAIVGGSLAVESAPGNRPLAETGDYRTRVVLTLPQGSM
jgi:signal transduction histidine kinase